MKGLRILFFVVLNVICIEVNAKEGIEWLGKEYNFGLIREEDGIREGDFMFVNLGNKPVEISEIRVACGCTGTEYDKKTIEKGDTARIKVFFDPIERPGEFDKGIYVYLKDESLPETVRIKGTVIASDETLQLFYPYKVQNIHFDTINIDYGDVKKGTRRRDFVDIYNSGMGKVTPTFSSDSDALTWIFEPSDIKPGESSTLTVYLDSSKVTWTGKKSFKILCKWDSGEQEIVVEAIVIPE